jgi:hypothetical protein
MTTTPNLDMELPAFGSNGWHTDINGNLSIIDTAVGGLQSVVDDLAYTERFSGTFNSTTGTAHSLGREVDAVNEYTVKVEALERTAAIGDIYVTKTTSGFTVKCSGGNTADDYEATVTYIGDVASYGGSVYRRYYVSPSTSITDHSVAGTTGSLAYILAAISTNNAIVELPGNRTYTLTAGDVTVPANVVLSFQKGAVISVASSRTLTINGSIAAGIQQIFDGAGAVSIASGTQREVLPDWFGAEGDGTTVDDDAFEMMSAALSTYAHIRLVPGKNYRLESPNLVLLQDGMSIFGHGSRITIPSGATPTDTTGDGDGFLFDNGIFYLGSGAVVEDVIISGVEASIENDYFTLLQVGSVASIAGQSDRGRITMEHCKITDGGIACVLVKCDVVIRNNNFEDLEAGIYAPACSGVIAFNRHYRIGVNASYTTWQNVSAIRAVGAQDLTIANEDIEYTGGTAIFCRATSLDVKNFQVVGCKITAAGLSAISATSYTGSSGEMNNVNIARNTIIGYACAVNADSHSGINVGAGGTSAATHKLISVTENQIDLISPDETFSHTTKTVTGGYNTKKAASTDMGVSPAIGATFYSDANEASGIVITGNNIAHAKNYGITAEYAQGVLIANNHLQFTGWERAAGTDIPLNSSAAIEVRYCLAAHVLGNALHNAAYGCDGSSQLTIPIRYVRSLGGSVKNNSLFQDDEDWAYCPIMLSGSGTFSEFGFTTETHTVDVGGNSARNFYYFANATKRFYEITNTIIISGIIEQYLAPNSWTVYAPEGTLYRRRDGGSSTSLYVKESDESLATDWTAK